MRRASCCVVRAPAVRRPAGVERDREAALRERARASCRRKRAAPDRGTPRSAARCRRARPSRAACRECRSAVCCGEISRRGEEAALAAGMLDRDRDRRRPRDLVPAVRGFAEGGGQPRAEHVVADVADDRCATRRAPSAPAPCCRPGRRRAIPNGRRRSPCPACGHGATGPMIRSTVTPPITWMAGSVAAALRLPVMMPPA